VLGAREKTPSRRGTIGTLIFWAVIGLGVFLGMVIISLLSMAQKADQVYDLMDRAEKMATPEDHDHLPESEILSPKVSGEAHPPQDLSGWFPSDGALITPE
jgi:hypothetical protein